MKNKRHPSKLLHRGAAALLAVSIAGNIMSVGTIQRSAAEAKRANEALDNAAEKIRMYQEKIVEQRELLDVYMPVSVASLDPAPPCYFDVPLDEDLQTYIYGLCSAYGIVDNYEIIYAIIEQESRFTADIVSASNDYGLMQINKINHEWLSEKLGIVDFLDPYENVHAGIYILAKLLNKYETSDALMAYNMGEGGAARLWRQGIHSTPYTEQVLDRYKKFTDNI